MCAICGVAGSRRPVAVELLRAMARTMAYRGPDDEGYFADGGAGLGHRRLSIIDVGGGRQPFVNEAGDVALVCNGEIYNFAALRDGLESRGHRFRSRSDNEVVLHLYEEEGTDCLKRLRGMFAFAIWDGPRRRLFLARDRLGKKPLVYAATPEGGCVFASELKALLAYPGFSREVDPAAVGDYLTWQAIPSPRTIFRAARKLPPAHFLLWEDGGLSVRRYWDVDFTRKVRLADDGEYAESFWETLTEAVRLRMVADVPLGAFLSGGLDSTAVTAVMAGLSPRPVKTFSIGFEEEEYSELAHARSVAERFSTDHHEYVVRPDVVSILPKLVWHYNEPFADSSMIPTYYVARETRREVTVALNGDGGDESLGGYRRYRQTLLGLSLLGRYRALPCRRAVASAAAALHRLRPDFKPFRAARWLTSMEDREPWFMYAHRMWLYSDEIKRSLLTPGAAVAAGGSSLELLRRAWEDAGPVAPLERMLYADFRLYLPEVLMVKMDIATMAVALEGRSPFLDHVLVEKLASFPPETKLRGGVSKFILRRKLKGLVPDGILRRGKMGFSPPIREWFRGPLRGLLEETLTSARFRGRGYFDAGFVSRMLSEYFAGARDWSHGLWLLLNLELWHRIFIDGERP